MDKSVWDAYCLRKSRISREQFEIDERFIVYWIQHEIFY